MAPCTVLDKVNSTVLITSVLLLVSKKMYALPEREAFCKPWGELRSVELLYAIENPSTPPIPNNTQSYRAGNGIHNVVPAHNLFFVPVLSGILPKYGFFNLFIDEMITIVEGERLMLLIQIWNNPWSAW